MTTPLHALLVVLLAASGCREEVQPKPPVGGLLLESSGATPGERALRPTVRITRSTADAIYFAVENGTDSDFLYVGDGPWSPFGSCEVQDDGEWVRDRGGSWVCYSNLRFLPLPPERVVHGSIRRDGFRDAPTRVALIVRAQDQPAGDLFDPGNCLYSDVVPGGTPFSLRPGED